MDLAARAAAAQAASITPTPAATNQNIPDFSTPSLTTTFTPPPECSASRLTMLRTDAYRVWMNEPLPVANATFSDCYPEQFMTSYLQLRSGTAVPAFSPLVCPDDYNAVFSTTMPDRPLYIVCCPSGYTLIEPSTEVPDGRRAYNGTCASEMPASTTVTQYDNSSSTGIMVWVSTSGQAFARPIDGFAAFEETNGVILEPSGGGTTPTGSPTFSGSNPSSQPAVPGTVGFLTTPQLAGLISGTVGGVIVTVAILTALFILWRRGKRKQEQEKRNIPSQSAYPQNPHVGPYLALDEKALPMPPRTHRPYGPPAAQTYSGRAVAEMHNSSIKELPAGSYIEKDSTNNDSNDRFLYSYLGSESSRASEHPQELAASNPQHYTTEIQHEHSHNGADSATAVDRSPRSPRSPGDGHHAHNYSYSIDSMTAGGGGGARARASDPSHWRESRNTQATQNTLSSADWASAYDSLYETYGATSPVRSPGFRPNYPNPNPNLNPFAASPPHSSGGGGGFKSGDGVFGRGGAPGKPHHSGLEAELLRNLDAAHRVTDGYVASPVDAPVSAYPASPDGEGEGEGGYSPDVSPKTLLPRTFEPMPRGGEAELPGNGTGRGRGQSRAAELSRAAEYRRRASLYAEEAAINPFATPPSAPSPISAARKGDTGGGGVELRNPLSPDEEMRERERDGRSYNW